MTKRNWRRVTVWSFALIVVTYGGVVGWFAAHERELLYFPEKNFQTSPEEFGLSYNKVTIPSTDGVKLACWIISGSADTSSFWILYFHGNSGNVAKRGYVEHYAQLHKLGLNILTVDYRGYGESSGEPDEQGLYSDALASYDYLCSVQHVSPRRIIVYGYSLGSGVAVDLASRVQAAGLIIEGAYTSIGDAGQEHYPFLPVKWIIRNRYDSKKKIVGVTIPKLFIHAVDDRTIPIHHGRDLFALAPEPKTFLEVKGGHDNAHNVDAVLFYGGIQLFLIQVRTSLHTIVPNFPAD